LINAALGFDLHLDGDNFAFRNEKEVRLHTVCQCELLINLTPLHLERVLKLTTEQLLEQVVPKGSGRKQEKLLDIVVQRDLYLSEMPCDLLYPCRFLCNFGKLLGFDSGLCVCTKMLRLPVEKLVIV